MTFKSELVFKWFDNIRNLDTKNRLRHGEVYAKDGSVQDFKIEDNIVQAKVEGVPGEFHKVKITFKTFTGVEKEKLVGFIQSNQKIYADLLNNELPMGLFTDCGVKILPDSIKEFKIECGCNNKSLFCKHKAAVFHYLLNEVWKDPFLILSLRGFDLDNLIEERNIKIKSIDDILSRDNIEFKQKNVDFDLNDIPFSGDRFDFLLDSKTDFYSSNTFSFKDLLLDTLKSMSEAMNKIKNPGFANEYREFVILGNTLRNYDYIKDNFNQDSVRFFIEKWDNPYGWFDFSVDINRNYGINSIEVDADKFKFSHHDLKRVLFALFAEFDSISMDYYNENFKFFYKIYLLTSELIIKQALVPEFFKLENEKFCIRWIPSSDKYVSEIINNLAGFCPSDLITCNGDLIDKDKQVIIAVSLMFNGFTSYYIDNFMPYSLQQHKNNIYYRLFFSKSQNFTVRGVENRINNWLSPLYLEDKKYSFFFDITQKEGEFLMDFKVHLDDGDVKLSEIMSSSEYQDIIRDTSVVNEIFAKFHLFFDLKETKTYNLSEFLFFLESIQPALKSAGMEVNVPEEFKSPNHGQIILDIDDDQFGSSLTLEDLSKFNWKVAIGDETCSLNDFKNMSRKFHGLVKLNNKYVLMDELDLIKIINQKRKVPKEFNSTEIFQFLLSGEAEELNIRINDKLSALMDEVTTFEEIKPPSSLKGNLRHYQETGFSWLLQNIKTGFGSILADDMGLGKTLQVLTAILFLKENDSLKGNVLVIAPTSLLSNWQKEIEKFTPGLTSDIYHGSNRELNEDVDIILTSYGIIRQDLDLFKDKEFYLTVVDEAQNIKNPSTKQTKAIKSISSKHKIALSGTPIENRLSEYWSIFDFINKGYLFNLKIFKEKFINPIEKYHDKYVLDSFKKITAPFILRRHKNDKTIIKDLPDKIVNDVYCNLTVKQAAMYEETLNVLIRDVEESDGINRKGIILKLITSLKQICNHPAQFSKSDKMTINESGKMEVLINTLENILGSDEKVLIFTQYVQMGDILKKLIEDKFKEEVLFLNGSVSRVKRDEMVDKFQNSDESKIFILSLKAGGTGLNLTAAQNVIHYDLWWNPAVENQATDRAYRIGQTENVMVYRFITTGTFEERINQIINEKTELADMAIDGGDSFITEMDNNELKDMLRLRQL